jgi:hypothetical protein
MIRYHRQYDCHLTIWTLPGKESEPYGSSKDGGHEEYDEKKDDEEEEESNASASRRPRSKDHTSDSDNVSCDRSSWLFCVPSNGTICRSPKSCHRKNGVNEVPIVCSSCAHQSVTTLILFQTVHLVTIGLDRVGRGLLQCWVAKER